MGYSDIDYILLKKPELLTYVTSHINPLEYYTKEFGTEFTFGKNIPCPFHDDKTPSFHIYEAGNFKCFGCEVSGGGVVKYHELKYCMGHGNKSFDYALMEMYERYIGPIVSQERIRQAQENLAASSDIQSKIYDRRGIHYNVLKRFRCGIDQSGKILNVPYQNQYGVWANMIYLNVFKTQSVGLPSWYLKIEKDGVEHRFDTGRVWPCGQVLANPHADLFIFEGYYDCMLALSLGLNAVTMGGAGLRMKGEDFPLLTRCNINIVFDHDKAGKQGAQHLAEHLNINKVGKDVRIIELPSGDLSDKFDFSDWVLTRGGSAEELIKIVKKTEPFKISVLKLPVVKNGMMVNGESVEVLSLKQAKTEGYGKEYKVNALVIGKEVIPITLPKKVRVTCSKGSKKCEGCVLWETDNKTLDWDLDLRHLSIANFVGQGRGGMTAEIKVCMGLSPRCPISIHVLTSYAAHWLYLSEPLTYESDTSSKNNVDQGVALCTIDVNTNMTYCFKGFTVTNPKNATQFPLLYEALPVSSELDQFEVTEDVVGVLKPFKIIGKEDLWEGLMQYYDHVARSITQIWGRPITHMAIDLVFFSPVSFYFQNQFIRKGSLDVVIFGDTRCGKSNIAESLQRYYKVGEVISGESCSIMNLLGGIKRESEFSGVAWGRMVLRHRDTIVIDEMSGIHEDDISKLSRIRSEGIANIDKFGHHQTANANAGLLWLTNPREGRLLRTYNYGLEALYSLQPRPEDVARFDYAHAVAIGEVPSRDVNAYINLEKALCKHTSQQCNSLICWIKSRKPSQIRFTEDCVRYILNMAQRLGSEYSTSVPLILAENARMKLAKISCAIAGRIWSTSPDDYETLVVDERCAQAAVKFLREIYNSSTMGYSHFSNVERSSTKVDVKRLEMAFILAAEQMRINMKVLCEKIMTDNQIVEKDIKLLFGSGFIDQQNASDFLTALKRANALKRKYQYYVKQEEFIQWLRAQIER
ncbi:MAG: CHC2 zinc finger domain-containing protein [Pseudomonadota bacterium]